MAEQYLAVLVTFVFAGALVAIMIALGRLLGPRRESAVKGAAFECGNPATGSAWGRFSVKFYLTAILFIVFDVEVVFMYPWAVAFRRLGWGGFAAMAILLFVAVIGLLYEWRKGALQWE